MKEVMEFIWNMPGESIIVTLMIIEFIPFVCFIITMVVFLIEHFRDQRHFKRRIKKARDKSNSWFKSKKL